MSLSILSRELQEMTTVANHDLKLSAAWVVTHSLQYVAGTHPPPPQNTVGPACLPELEGNLNAPESD